MNDRLDGVKLAGAGVRELGDRNGRGLSREAALSLARSGRVAYRVIDPSGAAPSAALRGSELRGDARRRTRLRSAKVLDAANAFVCEAMIQDRSAAGLRLLLSRNVGLPGRFGVHDDETGEVLTATAAWRRGQTLGVRVLKREPAAPLKRSDRLALGGRYYGVRD
jgi:hypothetical protein